MPSRACPSALDPREDEATPMPVEFLGIAATNNGSEVTPRSGASFDKDYTLKLARAHEDYGWDRVLFAYGSGSPTPPRPPPMSRPAPRPCSSWWRTAPMSRIRRSPRRPSRRWTGSATAGSRCTSSPVATTTNRAARATPSPRTSATTAPANTSASSRRSGPPMSPSTTRAPTTASTTSSRTPSPSNSPTRRYRSGAPRRRRTRRAAPRRTSTACGVNRWHRPPSRSPR